MIQTPFQQIVAGLSIRQFSLVRAFAGLVQSLPLSDASARSLAEVLEQCSAKLRSCGQPVLPAVPELREPECNNPGQCPCGKSAAGNTAEATQKEGASNV